MIKRKLYIIFISSIVLGCNKDDKKGMINKKLLETVHCSTDYFAMLDAYLINPKVQNECMIRKFNFDLCDTNKKLKNRQISQKIAINNFLRYLFFDLRGENHALNDLNFFLYNEKFNSLFKSDFYHAKQETNQIICLLNRVHISDMKEVIQIDRDIKNFNKILGLEGPSNNQEEKYKLYFNKLYCTDLNFKRICINNQNTIQYNTKNFNIIYDLFIKCFWNEYHIIKRIDALYHKESNIVCQNYFYLCKKRCICGELQMVKELSSFASNQKASCQQSKSQSKQLSNEDKSDNTNKVENIKHTKYTIKKLNQLLENYNSLGSDKESEELKLNIIEKINKALGIIRRPLIYRWYFKRNSEKALFEIKKEQNEKLKEHFMNIESELESILWECKYCTIINLNYDNKCRVCEKPKNAWECICTTLNEEKSSNCKVCNRSRKKDQKENIVNESKKNKSRIQENNIMQNSYEVSNPMKLLKTDVQLNKYIDYLLLNENDPPKLNSNYSHNESTLNSIKELLVNKANDISPNSLTRLLNKYVDLFENKEMFIDNEFLDILFKNPNINNMIVDDIDFKRYSLAYALEHSLNNLKTIEIANRILSLNITKQIPAYIEKQFITYGLDQSLYNAVRNSDIEIVSKILQLPNAIHISKNCINISTVSKDMQISQCNKCLNCSYRLAMSLSKKDVAKKIGIFKRFI